MQDEAISGLPAETERLPEPIVRSLPMAEQVEFIELLAAGHYLKNPTVVGRTLRYLAEYQEQRSRCWGSSFATRNLL